MPSTEHLPLSSEYGTGAADPELAAVRAVILAADPDGRRIAAAIRRTFDMLLDGQNTGRFRWDQLFKTEKTHAGTLVEINLQREFVFPSGKVMDYRIAGIEVDCKYSQDEGKWMLPPEAMGHLCLGLWADDEKGRWSAGLFRVREELLGKGKNRDGKRTLSAAGRDHGVVWLFRGRPLPDNVLLRLSCEDTEAIFAPSHGTKRTDELFRRTLGRLVSRTVVETVAQQDDSLKRVRGNGGSRESLRPEGIVILGHYGTHQKIAQQLGLPVPGRGEFVSVRLAPRPEGHDGDAWVELEGKQWIVGPKTVPAKPVPAPVLPKLKRGEGE